MKFNRLAVAAITVSLASLAMGSAVFAQTPVPQPTPTPLPRRPRPAPTPSPTPTPSPAPGTPQGAPQQGQIPARPQAQQTAKPRPYGDVITKEAKTDKGLITTHQIDDKVYFEVPKAVLGKPLLWVTSFSRIQTGYMPFGLEVQDRVVTWERRGDKLLLRSVDYQMRSKSEDTRRSLDLSNLPGILLVFNVAANGPDDSAVIDATSILNSDVTEFSPRRALGAARLDPNRTFTEKVKSFPTNVQLDVLATYVTAPTLGFGGGGGGPRRDSGSDSVSVVLHHSIVALPEKPMKPRLADERVGFFSTSFYEFAPTDKTGVKTVTYINRWRLEKKDPNAALSEPVKPITYYIAPEVPQKWHSYIKAGVESWNGAFEKAGFKNAVVCREAPTAEEDPAFNVDDVSYSVIRWLPSTVENAYGPSIVDPRTGEILNASPKFFHNVLQLSEQWYFTQASPNDPRAQKLPLPEDLTGRLLQYVVAHEIGHTLGFPHNKKASSSVPVKLLRDPAWTKEWGTEASIMDYGRFNYVAQPGDGASLIPVQGPYDMFAVEWGYKPLPGEDPEAEKPALDTIAQRQVKDPMLRFGHGEESRESVEDPGQRSEDLGADPIEATRLGLLNIDRVMTYLVPATTKPGDDYSELQELFGQVLGQRQRELGNVAALVGGFTQTNYAYQQGGSEVYTPIPAAQQKKAIAFLNQYAFKTPTNILRPDLLARIQSSGASDTVLNSQMSLLMTLLSDGRAKRMTEQEALYKGKMAIYTLPEMMEDVRKGIWTEVVPVQAATTLKPVTSITIDPYRRNLQRQYIAALGTRLDGTSSEMRPLSRLALMDTQTAIKAALPRVTDRSTKAHLLDCQQMIQNYLKPKGS